MRLLMRPYVRGALSQEDAVAYVTIKALNEFDSKARARARTHTHAPARQSRALRLVNASQRERETEPHQNK